MKAATELRLKWLEKYGISIHAAREGGDPSRSCGFAARDISIHAAREGGDGLGRGQRAGVKISIHAAREGGDQVSYIVLLYVVKFQSTPPVKAATRRRRCGTRPARDFNPRRP